MTVLFMHNGICG